VAGAVIEALTAVPELLGAAAHRFEAYAQAGGTRHV